MFSAYFSGFLRVRKGVKAIKILGVFEVFLGIFEKTKEKKDRAGMHRNLFEGVVRVRLTCKVCGCAITATISNCSESQARERAFQLRKQWHITNPN